MKILRGLKNSNGDNLSPFQNKIFQLFTVCKQLKMKYLENNKSNVWTFFETHRHIEHIVFDVFFIRKTSKYLCVLCVYVFQKISIRY